MPSFNSLMVDFRERLIEHYGFTDRDWEETVSRFRPETLPARSFFLEKGQVASRLAYLRSGMMRSFFYDDQANDISTHFFRQGTVVISMKSFSGQVPSRENIIAMEDCEMDVITHAQMLELMEKVPAWRQIAKDVDEFKYNALMNRSIQRQTLTASERYRLFVKKYPDILQKVALKHIASYLGIDIATLSRIRRSI
ncbi:MAG: Crp/Fnr family transcriptional regulator [Bacteroidales bacterium]|nr:Crp/Fnr family transcriptional regulator [Bacteroidales bacterium]